MNDQLHSLVTIVVASYNHRHYIEKAIASLFAQDYPALEIIVIDDGSTDGSGEFLEELCERFDFRLIRRENGGLVSVINLGINEARGEFIIFHASDDESLPGRVTGQVEVLNRHPGAAFVSGNVAFITEVGREVGTLLHISGRERELGFDDLFLHRARVSSVASMYRGAALRQMGSISEQYLAEDPQIFLRLTSLGYSWVQWSGPPVIAYRMLFSSQSRTTMPLLESQLVQLVDEFAEHPLHRSAAARARAGLFSALAESNKRAAIRLALTSRLAWGSVTAARGIAKILVPQRLHCFFKRAGR